MLPNLSGKVALCVGTSSAIGRAVANRLAFLQANVAVTVKDQYAGQAVVRDLKLINPEGNYEVISCDTTSMKSIDEACAEFGKVYGKLNYLVMSENTPDFKSRTLTTERIDERMALKYYSRIQCIRSLQSIMKETATTEEIRVLSILSGGTHGPYKHLEDLGLKKNYDLVSIENASGFYTDLAFDQMSREWGDGNFSWCNVP